MSAHLINRDHMVGIVFRFEIKDQRRKPKRAQRRRAEDRTFEAVCRPLANYSSRRPRRPGQMIRSLIKTLLNPGWRFERAQEAHLRRRETPIRCGFHRD